ncbi:hypothetical protein A33O_01687 [Nitratireductor aquibiodomus RA22]|uniref:Uncharacterized protein n=1 Tax=Nitratireductor aquibiodomus RA22 TaxID=1189611 RepID=I5C7G7_9HYPH|nr:hypothetical protein A33O_01687 [Nitratireductor aquibiodomus RA22]
MRWLIKVAAVLSFILSGIVTHSSADQLSDAFKEHFKPDVVRVGELRLRPYSSEAEHVARKLAGSLSDATVRAYGFSRMVETICSLYGYALVGTHRDMSTLVRGSHFLDYLTDQQYEAWKLGSADWVEFRGEHEDDGPKVCATLSASKADLLRKKAF